MRRESVLTSLAIHAAVLLFLFGIVVITAPVPTPNSPVILANPKLAPYTHNPGSGGQHAKTESSPGRLPPRGRTQFIMPLIAPTNPAPKLITEATLDLPPHLELIDSPLPNLGDPAGLGKLLSGGMKGTGGIGNGPGGTIGSGPGTGVGEPGVYIPGRGGVTMPVAIHTVEPEYSDEARKAHAMGTVLVAVEIGPDGKPRNVRITRGFGLGLDEKALEAVKQWRFRPGTKDGKPVAVAAQIEVAFHLL